jgi:DNA invertase Pin-like site-specific DNA recombinase
MLIRVVFVKENLTFTGEDSPMSNLLLSVMGAFAQFERELIRERDSDCKREGKYSGRKPSLTPARGRVAAASCRWRLEGCACS